MINLDINGQYVNYLDYGNKKKDAIVLLHGWGQNIEMMQMLGEPFKNEYRIIIVDFPGFGLSPEPKRVMDVNDYTILIEELLKKLKVKNPILIGHSFGGRVSVKYASRNDVKKVILLSPALRGHDKKGLKTKILKSLKTHYAAQGEFCAPNVQKGIYKNGTHFYVYLVKNLDTGKKLSADENVSIST